MRKAQVVAVEEQVEAASRLSSVFFTMSLSWLIAFVHRALGTRPSFGHFVGHFLFDFCSALPGGWFILELKD